MSPVRRHDLLRLHPRASLIFDAPAPDWVAVCLAETPWVVVRQGEIRDGVIPIRVRGPARKRRLDALISISCVAYRSTPEDLAGRRCEPWRAAKVPADLVLREKEPPSLEQARELFTELAEAAAPARIDVLVETRQGGINLASLAL